MRLIFSQVPQELQFCFFLTLLQKKKNKNIKEKTKNTVVFFFELFVLLMKVENSTISWKVFKKIFLWSARSKMSSEDQDQNSSIYSSSVEWDRFNQAWSKILTFIIEFCNFQFFAQFSFSSCTVFPPAQFFLLYSFFSYTAFRPIQFSSFQFFAQFSFSAFNFSSNIVTIYSISISPNTIFPVFNFSHVVWFFK